jgi:hypothetical protein
MDVQYKAGSLGPNVVFDVSCEQGTIRGLLPPAQAREIAAVLCEMADRVEAWEGVTGQAQRDAIAHVGVQYLLGAQGGVENG